MNADRLESLLQAARDTMSDWAAGLPSHERVKLAACDTVNEVTKLSYIDGYWRIRRTTPLILKTIERLESLGEDDSARFWIAHLTEEVFHDRIMRHDLDRMFGSPAAATAVLQASPISPPSTALVGYYEWQIAHGTPHLLIVLRLFLEWYFSRIDDRAAAKINAMIEGGSAVLAIHRNLDIDHVKSCFDYIERNCGTMLAVIIWSLNFTADCLRESQIWAAKKVLGLAE